MNEKRAQSAQPKTERGERSDPAQKTRQENGEPNGRMTERTDRMGIRPEEPTAPTTVGNKKGKTAAWSCQATQSHHQRHPVLASTPAKQPGATENSLRTCTRGAGTWWQKATRDDLKRNWRHATEVKQGGNQSSAGHRDANRNSEGRARRTVRRKRVTRGNGGKAQTSRAGQQMNKTSNAHASETGIQHRTREA